MKKTLLSVFSVLLISSVHGQTIDLGGPISWKETASKTTIPSHVFPGFDLTKIQEEDAINDQTKSAPWRFGYKYSSDFTLDNSGQWEELPNGDRVWRLELIAPGAMTMNLLLEDVELPSGSQLYLFDKERTNRVGAYTYRNNHPSKELGTELVHGDDIIVEYYEPAHSAGEGQFTIANVIHGYRSLDRVQSDLAKGLNDSGSCNIDVNCPLGDIWGNQIRSVAMIVVGGSGICTGALINNTCDDGRPLFLTANHCLGGSTGNWAFRFNWQSPEGTESCATNAGSQNPGPPYDQTANGATVLENGTQADFALLEINNMTESDAIDWGAFYAGWNSNDQASAITSTIGIHHPSGDVKKICKDNDAPYHQNVSGASVWFIDEWEEGVTEPGSSGSPLFDQEGRIIGQLFGGAAACSGTNNNGQYDFYGRLGTSWNLGVKDHLAPASCGGDQNSNYGFDPNTSTADVKAIDLLDLTVSPNPTSGSFNIATNNGDALNGDIIITDMTGRVVYQQTVATSSVMNVNLTHLSEGSYILLMNAQDRVIKKTVIIAK